MSDYSAASIRVLKDLEPVKERPGMYTRTTCPTHVSTPPPYILIGVVNL